MGTILDNMDAWPVEKYNTSKAREILLHKINMLSLESKQRSLLTLMKKRLSYFKQVQNALYWKRSQDQAILDILHK